MQGFGPIPEELKKSHIVLSASKLIEFKKSPRHYWWKYILKRKETTDSMEKGTLIHMAVLEPERFAKEYCTIPAHAPSYSGDELQKLCKDLGLAASGTKFAMTERIRTKNPEFWTYDDEMKKLEASGKKVISQEEWDMCETIVDQINHSKVSGTLLKNAQKEISGYFSPMPGILISFRIDAFTDYEGKGVLIDVKTSRDVSKRYVERTNYQDGRHIQFAIYCDALSAIKGRDFSELSYFLFIENSAPYCLAEHHADNGMMDAGKSEYKSLIKKLVKCHETNKWPGPQSQIETTTLAPWDFERVLVDEEQYEV